MKHKYRIIIYSWVVYIVALSLLSGNVDEEFVSNIDQNRILYLFVNTVRYVSLNIALAFMIIIGILNYKINGLAKLRILFPISGVFICLIITGNSILHYKTLIDTSEIFEDVIPNYSVTQLINQFENNLSSENIEYIDIRIKSQNDLNITKEKTKLIFEFSKNKSITSIFYWPIFCIICIFVGFCMPNYERTEFIK